MVVSTTSRGAGALDSRAHGNVLKEPTLFGHPGEAPAPEIEAEIGAGVGLGGRGDDPGRPRPRLPRLMLCHDQIKVGHIGMILF